MPDKPAEPKPKYERPKGNGPGLWGPAKGGGDKPAYDFARYRRTTQPNDADKIAARAARREWLEEQADLLKDHLLHMATDPEMPPMVHLQAAVAFLDRVEGKPVARNQLSGPDGQPIATEVVYRWAVPEEEDDAS